MRRCYHQLFLLLSLAINGHAQQLSFDGYPAFYQTQETEFLDSLSKAQVKSSNDSIRAVGLFVKGFLRMRETTALQKFDSALLLVRNLENDYLLALNAYWKGNWFARRGKFDSCLVYTTTANNQLTSIDSDADRYLKFGILHQLANASFDLLRFEEALSWALDALRLANESDNAHTIVRVHMILGTIYGELSDPTNGLGSEEQIARYDQLAVSHLKKAYDFAVMAQDPKRMTICALNVAVYYSVHHNVDSSNHYLDIALNIVPESDALGKARIYDLYAENELEKENLESALLYAKTSLPYAREVGRPRMIVKVLTMVAHTNALLQNYSLAESYFDSAQSLNESTLFDLNRAQVIEKGLYELYLDKRDYKNALSAYISYAAFLDSIQQKENLSRIEDLQLKYETEKKDNEIKNLTQERSIQQLELRQKNLYLIVSGCALLLVIAFGLMVYRQRKYKEQIRVDDLNQRLLRSQLNPHFLFNALNAIQQKVLSEADKQLAADYLAKFSHLTRQILEQNRDEYISVEEEIELLQRYLDLQKLRTSHQIDVVIDVSEEIETDRVKMPPMLTQPIVENAFEHGLLPKNSDGKLSITFSAQNDNLEIVIKDNGIGYGSKSSNHHSMSGSITQDRLNLLQKKTGRKCSLDITSGKEEMDTFTKVTLTIPLL